MSRSNLIGADGVVASSIVQPPRLRELLWLRGFFLIAQPPLLQKEGNASSSTSIPVLDTCGQRQPRQYIPSSVIAFKLHPPLCPLHPSLENTRHGSQSFLARLA